jgi:hypothetical protein
MQQNELLSTDLYNRALADAQNMYNDCILNLSIDESYAMAIENGEGIVGYQYLHGTDSTQGGFQRRGTATMAFNGASGFDVTMEMTYTWNDTIDPNPQYGTDMWKSNLAENITFGRADPYTLHITWTETIQIHLNGYGRPIP